MLELDGLHRRFEVGPRAGAHGPQVVVALDGLTFTVARGELCGFLGPNGAGKTTAMRAVLGVTRLDGGEVRWDGRPIDRQVRRRTGYLPEERGLYPKMPVAEQLVYFGRLHGLDRAEARRRTDACSPSSASRTVPGTRPSRSASATSSGSSSRPRWCTTPSCSCSTSRSRASTRSRSTRCRRCCDAAPRRAAAVVFSSHQLDLVEDLCQTVAVVADGRGVLTGELDALRAAGEQRLRVAVEGDPSWVDRVPDGAVPRGSVRRREPRRDLRARPGARPGSGPGRGAVRRSVATGRARGTARLRAVPRRRGRRRDGGGGGVTVFQAVALVAGREVRQRLRSKAHHRGHRPVRAGPGRRRGAADHPRRGRRRPRRRRRTDARHRRRHRGAGHARRRRRPGTDDLARVPARPGGGGRRGRGGGRSRRPGASSSSSPTAGPGSSPRDRRAVRVPRPAGGRRGARGRGGARRCRAPTPPPSTSCSQRSPSRSRS